MCVGMFMHTFVEREKCLVGEEKIYFLLDGHFALLLVF